MEKQNHLDELPIASLTEKQLALLQSVENTINQDDAEDVYLIALKKQRS
jgi:hypothetical protein